MQIIPLACTEHPTSVVAQLLRAAQDAHRTTLPTMHVIFRIKQELIRSIFSCAVYYFLVTPPPLLGPMYSRQSDRGVSEVFVPQRRRLRVAFATLSTHKIIADIIADIIKCRILFDFEVVRTFFVRCKQRAAQARSGRSLTLG